MRRQAILPIFILSAYAATVCLNASFRHSILVPASGGDIIQRMFGGFRTAVGDWAFMKAEEYHHRGLPLERALAYHHGESLLSERNDRGKEDEHEHEAVPENEGASLYEKLYHQVKVTKDSHLKPEDEKEVLPWFYVETAFNPHDIRGYILGSYWLDRVGKRDESMKFLTEGEKNNPGSAQILGAIGELYSKENNYEKAVEYLEGSCSLWLEARGANAVTNSYEDSDRLFAFDLLASLYMRKGNNDKALKIYTELLKFGPNPAILDKVSQIKAGVKR